MLGGTLGYLALGFDVLDSIYATVTTIATVAVPERLTTNPAPETVIQPGHILIAIGTAAQLAALVDASRPGS